MDYPWCFVVDQKACLERAGESSWITWGDVWDKCGVGDLTDHHCRCELSWSYGGTNFAGCSQTKDFNEKWCYVRDGAQCDGSVKTTKEGLYWDTCSRHSASPPSSPSLAQESAALEKQPAKRGTWIKEELRELSSLVPR